MNLQWDGIPVLVTGCNGFVGKWLVEELLDKGATVFGLSHDWKISDWVSNKYNSNLTYIRGSVEDITPLERILNEYQIDTVFHLAAQSIVSTANRNPLSTFETNIRGTWNLLEACRRNGKVKRIIVASSDKAYGIQKLPYMEDMPLNGRYPYDVSKSCVDLISSSYHYTYGLPVCIVRCSNIYGGGDLNFSRLVPATIRSLINNEPPKIRIGIMSRDYLYIRDAVLAYISLAEKMGNLGTTGIPFNFGSGVPITVNDMVYAITKQMGSDIAPEIISNTDHVNEIHSQYLSIDRANILLEWDPEYTLEAGLEQTINWYKNYFRSN